eukprot:11701346-Karenia_brevis.AAC.1
MSNESRESLRQACLACEMRINLEFVAGQRKYYLQSKYVSSNLGGHVWTAKTDGRVWMNLGDGK